MLEQACVIIDGETISDLADAMVYYGIVDVEATSGTIASLCRKYGHEQICALIDSGNLRLLYSKNHYVVQSEGAPVPTHKFISFFHVKDAKNKSIKHPNEAIELSLRATFPGDFRVRKMAREISERLIVKPYYPEIERLATEDLRDPAYRDAAIATVLNELVPGCVDATSFKLEFIDLGDRFVVPMPLDFRRLNERFHLTTSPEQASVSPAYVLAHLITARYHLSLGAERNGDMWLPSASAALINLRINSLANRLGVGKTQVSHFSDVVFEGRSFGAAIDRGMRTPAELVAFVQDNETMRLKKWIAGLVAEENLLVEFVKENGRRGLMESLPARAAKVSLFTGLGAVADATLASGGAALAAALGLAAVDEFIASKIKIGWRPNSWAQKGRAFLAPPG